MLADYSYYTNDFGGSVVPAESWQHTAEAASDWMCAVTFGRLDADIPVKYERQIKRCCCEIAEQMYLLTQSAHGGSDAADGSGALASEKNGEYSAEYRSPAETAAALLHGDTAGLNDVLQSIAGKHLGRTGLLYRGVE